MESTETILNASNIKCHGCASAVKAAVTRLPGVLDATVNVLEQTVTVTHDPQITSKTLGEALNRAGFPVA